MSIKILIKRLDSKIHDLILEHTKMFHQHLAYKEQMRVIDKQIKELEVKLKELRDNEDA